MFSPLAKGNGSWDGHFDDEPTFESLLPSIYHSSTHNDVKQTTETIFLTKTQEKTLHLPKTFLTRKGAILLFAKNGKQSGFEREKPNKNDGTLKDDSLVTTEEEIPLCEKRKLFLEFLEVFLKDQTTNEQRSSNPINLKENNWTSKQKEETTENVFKILSRPKSINSFYNHETQGRRPKGRPNTAVPVIPNEPEQPKAHPRITSGKPRPPTRALGKLSSKNTRSEFDKEKSNFLRPPSPESHLLTRQLATPNYSTTNEMVQDDHISVPRPNSECYRSEKVSRAASSMSRYSAWWAMDDVSLSYYDNELQDHENPECIECLSERRSEIGHVSTSDHRSDIDADEGPTLRLSTPDIENTKDTESTVKLQEDNTFSVKEENEEYFCPSRRDSQPRADLEKKTNALSTTDSGDLASEAIQDVWCEEGFEKQPCIRNRVKSASNLQKTNDSKFRRKVYSAGLKRTCKATTYYSEHETTATTTPSEDSFIRVPSAASCYECEDTDSKDIAGKPAFSEYGIGDLVKDSNIALANQILSVETSYPGRSLETSSVEGSGCEIETKDRISDDQNPVKKDFKTTTQDIKSAKKDIKPVKQDSRTTIPALLQKQETECTTSEITQDTEIGDGRQDENNSGIPPIVLSPGGNDSGKDNKDNTTILQYVEQKNRPVQKAESQEILDSEDNDSVTSLANSDIKIELEADEVPPSPTFVDGVERTQTPAPDSGTGELVESFHSNAPQVKAIPVDTDDSKVFVREIHLLSGKNVRKDELNDEAGSHDFGEVNASSNAKKRETTANAGTGMTTSSDNTTAQSGKKSTIESGDSSKSIRKQEVGGSGLAIKQKTDSQGRKDSVAGISERKINDKPLDKSKLDENSKTKEVGKSAKVKTEKPKREKLDIKGVGKADNMVTDTKDKVEIKLQNKTTTGKKTRSSKPARNSILVSKEAPEPEPSLELIPTVDENLLKMIENPDGSLELSEETLNQFAPVENFQDHDQISVLEDKSNQASDAFAPSKVKKGRRKAGKSGKKKANVSESNMEEKAAKEERKIKMAEAKAKQDEEMKLLKEREEEQTRLLEEAKEKQRIIEEERSKRLAQENEARRQEEEAEKALKEAKRKAKEEREKRREEEAERRRMEVKKKREEKRKRELEIQKREQELEKQRVDREQRMAELQAQKERELELERIAEEQRQEEEKRRLLELEEEKRQEEARIREAEEAVQQMAREREYREQMRRIAEAQQAKLEKQEMERREKEEAERAAIEEERKRLEHEAQLRENEEQERVRELRQKEAIARIRAAHEASKRRAWALRRRAQNTERMANLRFTRQTQKLTEAFTFSYHVRVPREVWELPYDWNSKKKRGSFRPAKKKQKGEKKTGS